MNDDDLVAIPVETKKLKGKKVLCVCGEGVSRSVGLQWMLKRFYQIDALPVGVGSNSKETVSMLMNWADVIIITTYEIDIKKYKQYNKKILVWDVGPDRYFQGFMPDLIEQFGKYLIAYEKAL